MRVLVFLLTLLAAPFIAHAEGIPQAHLKRGLCRVQADEHWKPQEQFVWKRVCLGEEANFNIEQGYGGDLDPKDSLGLPENRVLSSKFLATILLSDKYRHALTRRGVRIIGARFTEQIDLQNAELSHDLWLDRSLLEKGADLRGLRSSRRITFYGSKIIGPLKMSRLNLRGDLHMDGKAEIGAVYLGFAHVGGTLDLTGSTFAKEFDMAGIQVDEGLVIEGAKFAGINLTSARANWLILNRSRVTGLLNMASLRVDNNLVMTEDEFADVLLGLAHVQGNVVLANSKVTGDLAMIGLQVDGNLMGIKTELNKMIISDAEVSGTLSLIGVTMNSDLSMGGIRVGRDVILSSISEKFFVKKAPKSLASSFDAIGLGSADDPTALLKARFAKVDLTGASVQRGLSLAGATVRGNLSMDGIQIGTDLTMVDGEYKAVDLERAKIAGVFNMRGSKVSGRLDCYASEIGSRLELSGADIAGPIICSFAKIGELDLAGGNFRGNVDLTATEIKSELRIGSAGKARTKWDKNSMLYLRNAKADAIHDLQDAWPNRIDFSGFVYRNLGGRNPIQPPSMADRPVSWFVAWLAKQNPYASEPYEQLARVLRMGGRPEAADEILYAGKERERAHATLSHRVWMTTIDVLIGYGYHLWRALAWVAGFILAGIAVLRFSGQGPRNQMPFGVAYSFDMLLPIIRLREKHYQIDLVGWPRYYFYVHKIMGYVLAYFLVAGLAGIIK